MNTILTLFRRGAAAVLGLGALASAHAATTMNIEVDYMVGAHSHRPQAAEVAAVVQMFACRGITLNIVVDDALPHFNVMPRDPGNQNNFFGYTGTNGGFRWFKNNYFDHAGQAGWHYCIFGHQYQDKDYTTTTSSGLGEISGDDFVVTLGAFDNQIGTAWDRAATLAHEFGHNLGLSHGQDGNYQLNKPSIMSYFYQLRGVKTAMIEHGLTSELVSLFKEMDYSDGRMISLNESSLNEVLGTAMVSVDWNCNGTISGVTSESLDEGREWCNSTNLTRDTLADMDEWAALNDTTKSSVPKNLDHLPEVGCVTADEIRAYLQTKGIPKAQPPVSSEACISAKMIYLKTGVVVGGNGRGSNPFTTLSAASSDATSGSHLFFIPGTYTLDNGPVVISKPMKIFCETGTAVVKPQ